MQSHWCLILPVPLCEWHFTYMATNRVFLRLFKSLTFAALFFCKATNRSIISQQQSTNLAIVVTQSNDSSWNSVTTVSPRVTIVINKSKTLLFRCIYWDTLLLDKYDLLCNSMYLKLPYYKAILGCQLMQFRVNDRTISVLIFISQL